MENISDSFNKYNIMKKKIQILIIILILSLSLSAQKSGNFSKGKFSNEWVKPDVKKQGPPNPGDGQGGNPIPISSGLSFLIISSLLYFGNKLYKENKV